MQWHRTESGASRTVGYAGDASSMREGDALKEMWRLVLEEVLPLNSGVAWDYVRVEIWADSGRLIVYPASTQNHLRIEKAACQVSFPSLLQESERIDAKHGDFLDADDFEAGAEARFIEDYKAMELAWIDNAAAAARMQLPHGSHLKLTFYSADDGKPLREVSL